MRVCTSIGCWRTSRGRPLRTETALSDAGFTLLELLVAVSITLVVAGLMLTVTTSVLDLWRRTQGMQGQAAAARQIFLLLEQDLQAALHRRDATCWLAADILDSSSELTNHGWLVGPGLMKPASGGSLRPLPASGANGLSAIRDARFGLSGLWLRFVSTNVESGGSLPTVVAWQVVRRPVTGDPVANNRSPVHYSLYRSVVSDAETFAGGYDVTDAVYGSTSNTPSSALSSAYRLPRNVTNPSHANLLATNVVDFGCWLHVRNATGELVPIYPTSAADVVHHAVGNSVTNDTRWPDVVDVMVRILTDEGATLVATIEGDRVSRPATYATDAEWWWAVVEAHSAVFVRRIETKAGAP